MPSFNCLYVMVRCYSDSIDTDDSCTRKFVVKCCFLSPAFSSMAYPFACTPEVIISEKPMKHMTPVQVVPFLIVTSRTSLPPGDVMFGKCLPAPMPLEWLGTVEFLKFSLIFFLYFTMSIFLHWGWLRGNFFCLCLGKKNTKVFSYSSYTWKCEERSGRKFKCRITCLV